MCRLWGHFSFGANISMINDYTIHFIVGRHEGRFSPSNFTLGKTVGVTDISIFEKSGY